MNFRSSMTGARGRVPATVLACLLGGGLLCGLALLMVAAPGCTNVPQGRGNAEGWTGGVAERTERGAPIVVTVTPPPWNSIAEAALGLISAGLATWNVQQHRRLAALEAAKPAEPRERESANCK